jgi:hypothetical protein
MSETHSPPLTSSFGRIRAFLREMFPVFPAQAATFGSFAVNAGILAGMLPSDTHPGWTAGLCGALTVVLWNLQLRCFDEIKDYSTDLQHFPDRPLVTGALLHSDLRNLLVWIQGALLALQIPFFLEGNRFALGIFAFTQLYSLASFKWFFFESRIRPNLVLALITHHPLVFFFQAYLLSSFSGSDSFFEAPTLPWVIAYLVGVSLIGTAWELARKIRGTKEETQYRTYSKIWGVPRASSTLLGVLAVSMLLWSGALFQTQGFSLRFLGTLLLPLLQLTWITTETFRFVLLKPEKSPPLKVRVELLALLVLVSLLGNILSGLLS